MKQKTIISVVLAVFLLSACGKTEEVSPSPSPVQEEAVPEASLPVSPPPSPGPTSAPSAAPSVSVPTASPAPGSSASPSPAPAAPLWAAAYAGEKIPEQSFFMDIPGFEAVEFVSYAPVSPEYDAVFALESGGQRTFLESMRADGLCPVEGALFSSVAAVGFPDCNNDGLRDIITLCEYKRSYSVHSHFNVYLARPEGSFGLDRALSKEVSDMLFQESIPNAAAYLSLRLASGTDWKAAYIAAITAYEGSIELKGGKYWALIPVSPEQPPILGYLVGYGGDLCYYDDYGTDSLHIRDSAYYLPYGGLFISMGGRFDSYYDEVYSLGQGGFICLGSGEYGGLINGEVNFDETYNRYINANYSWNGIATDRESYMANLLSLYPLADSVKPVRYSAQELIAMINAS